MEKELFDYGAWKVGRVEEWKSLPQEQWMMTFRGRYAHVDAVMVELLGYKEEKLADFSMLDVAGGVMSFGSPTAHDTFQKMKQYARNVDITVVDVNIPSSLKDANPHIRYERNLKYINEEFDCVRLMRLIEHTNEKEYARIKRISINRLSEGGLFISTQRVMQEYMNSRGQSDVIHRGNLIKIAQKRDKEMVPIMLLPDLPVPSPEVDLELTKDLFTKMGEYKNYRELVKNGSIKIDRKLRWDSYFNTLRVLGDSDISILNSEESLLKAANHSDDDDSYTANFEPYILKQLQENEIDAPFYFRKR